MPVTNTQEVFKISAIKPVSINPSILEGETPVPSLYGPSSAIAIDRFPPTNLSAPTISGIARLPSVLTCSTGVWSASPQPVYTYQWYLDGVIMVGETNSTITTDVGLVDQTLTCVVRAENTLGFVELLSSNGITVELVEPINLLQADVYAVSGLGSPSRVEAMSVGTYLVTGLGIDDTQSILTMDIYVTTFPV